jgi:hypothetical protein
VAEPIGDEQRLRLEQLLARGARDEAFRLLDQWTRMHEMTPWAMDMLGRLHLERGNLVEAGRFFFWAGTREGDAVAAAIAAFLRRSPAQLLTTLRPQARLPLDRLPPVVRQELLDYGVTPELAAAIAANRRPVRWGNLVEKLVLGGLLCVGLITCIRSLVAWCKGGA